MFIYLILLWFMQPKEYTVKLIPDITGVYKDRSVVKAFDLRPKTLYKIGQQVNVYKINNSTIWYIDNSKFAKEYLEKFIFEDGRDSIIYHRVGKIQ